MAQKDIWQNCKCGMTFIWRLSAQRLIPPRQGNLQWTHLALVVVQKFFCFGLCCSTLLSPEVVWSFPLQIQQMFLFSQLPHLLCKLSCQGPAIFPSVLIVLPLIHPFSFASLFPKWPPTPAMTLFTKLTGAPTVIGPASGKSTLTFLINWISRPSYQKEKAIEQWDNIVCWTHTHRH